MSDPKGPKQGEESATFPNRSPSVRPDVNKTDQAVQTPCPPDSGSVPEFPTMIEPFPPEAATVIEPSTPLSSGALHPSSVDKDRRSVQPPITSRADVFESPTMLDPAAPVEAPTALDLTPVSSNAAAASPARKSGGWSGALLESGTVLGGRYVILQPLGEGGMGAVYKAKDSELERIIALKVIRPELASNPEVLQRFKQEIILARQITDRNIIRIFDLGEADGIRFITMEYVEGESLYDMLRRRGKLPVDEVVHIMEQTLSGLRAAHREGVIHRDLKPGNIMRDAQGRIVVMDFGLARTLGGDGMTRSGAMLGTMEYMSPEQAQAMDLDSRSDIFTVGLICYELLSGKMPFHADSAVASLLKRTRERAIPISTIDREVPGVLSNIVGKCLERDPALRYQSAQDVLNDLHAWQGRSGRTRVSASTHSLLMNRLRDFPWKLVAGGIVAIALTSGISWYFGRGRPANELVQHTRVSVLVADFQNGTSDSLFDGTLEPAFNLALEGASFINAYSRGDAHKTAAELKPEARGIMDESVARLVAQREGVTAVVSGSISPEDKGYKISAKAVDTVTGNTIASEQISVQNKDEVLHSVGVIASRVRKALGDSTPESAQLLQTATFSSDSLEATHEYTIAQSLQYTGKWEEAVPHYEKAIQLDPKMGRAYAALGAAKFNLGRLQEAEQYYQQAMSHIDRMSDREKYRTRAEYFLVKHEPQQAIQEYTKLIQQFPSDTSAHTNLSFAYFQLRNMPKALEEARRSMEFSGKSLMERNNLAIASMYAGDFVSAEKEARTVMEQEPSYVSPYSTLAEAQIGQEQLDAAKLTYQKLSDLSPRGSSMANLGLADVSLYQGRIDEAIPRLESGIQDDLKNKDTNAAAAKLVVLAQAHLLAGHTSEAVSAAERAVRTDKVPSVLHAAGVVLVNASQFAKASNLAAQLGSGVEPDPQLYGKLLESEIALKRGDAKKAITLVREAEKISDTWMGHFTLARAYLEIGSFPEADGEIEVCLKRRGEVSALYLDELPTFRLFPSVYYYMGRVREGLKSPAAQESYQKFLSIQEGGVGPLIADARKHLARP